jgi:RES domain-containing protein
LQLRISLSKVADVRGSQQLRALGFGDDELAAEDWTTAQRVGAAAAWLGIAALLVPSARHADGNIVVFVNNLVPDDLVDPLPSSPREDPG